MEQVQVDLFTSLRFRSLEILQVREVMERSIDREDFSVPCPVDEAVLNLVTRLLYNGYIKEQYKPGILRVFAGAPEEARSILKRAFGTTHAAFVVQAVLAGNWPAIEQRAYSLRRSLLLGTLMRQPMWCLAGTLRDISRLFRRYLRPPGLSIVLLGPDGCGKSTALSGVVGGLRQSFKPDKGLEIHWKPIVFFRKRREGRPPTADPHGRPPRGVLTSLVFLAYHWAEYLLGAILQERWTMFRNGLVTIDRHYYDFMVDPLRYRLSAPSWAMKLGAALLPKPNLVFLLDAPAEILQVRKQEVPLEETQRQRIAFNELIKTMRNGHVIDASQAPQKVATDILRAVVQYLSNRTAQRLGRTHE